jgi:hypothetical protein
MEQAASQSASSSSWNEAAYLLAEQNVELDTAKKWAETAITIESALLRDLSLDHVTPTQMRLVGTMGNYWETLGWVYFRMGKAIGLSAASIRHGECIQLPPRENTLDRYTRSLGGEDAIHTYAMAVAAADLSKRGASSPEDLAEARGRLTQIAGQGADVAVLVERGRAALEALCSA